MPLVETVESAGKSLVVIMLIFEPTVSMLCLLRR